MSSKKLAYLLTVLMVCGLIAGGTAYGQQQTFGTLLISGTVTNPDGTAAAGLEVKAETVPAVSVLKPWTATSRNDGTFTIASERGAAQISAGDMIKLTVTNADRNTVGEMSLTIEENANTTFAGNTVIIKNINIQLRDSGIDVKLEPRAPHGNGTESTITVTVVDEGTGVTGDEITITADIGAVGDVTEVGNGEYTATYTSPPIPGNLPASLTITARSVKTGLEGSLTAAVLPPRTIVKLDVQPDQPDGFRVGTSSTGAVTVIVQKETSDYPVTGESIAFDLDSEAGSITAATDNGDGTYTATYTPGGTAGEFTLTATATPSGKSDEKTITINAGPPEDIALSASPMTVSSLGSSRITAMVTDAGGNPVGGLSLTGTPMSRGTVGDFTSTAFGTYAATYTAPLVEMGDEGPETITVTATDGVVEVSGNQMLDLTSEPPIDVSAIAIAGQVYKTDGEVPADGVTVTVTVGSNSPKTDTTAANGSYSAALVTPGTTAATTGDIVAVAVANANVVSLEVNGIVHSGSQFPLGNDILERVQVGERVTVNVTTDIVIPPRSVTVLKVQGTVLKESSTVSAGSGLTVTVTVGSNSPKTDTTDANGFYEVAFAMPGTPVATTGDPISVEVRDGSRVRSKPLPPKEATLSNTDLGTTGTAIVTRNVETDIKLTSNLLVVAGTVYLKNGNDPVAAMRNLRESDLTVVVTNTTRSLERRASVKDDGTYGAVFQSIGGAAVAETGDNLTLAVQNEAGEMVEVESDPHTLTGTQVQAARAEVDIHTTVRAIVNTLHVIGTVVDLEGNPAAGVRVTISVMMDGDVTAKRVVTTDAAGGYEDIFVKVGTPLAATGDALLVEALRESNQFIDSRQIMLSSHQLLNQPVEVNLQLRPSRLKLGGLSINTHYTGIQDPIVQKLLGMDLGTLAAAGARVLGIPAEDLLVMLPPSLPLLLSPILAAIGVDQLELPDGFDPANEHIDQESFGNAITTRPTAWITADERHSGRWFNGDQLQLYISGAPTIERVEFILNNGSPMLADRVPPGSTFSYTFQLEEELIALFEGAAFDAVQLMIDGHPQSPFGMLRNAMGVWSADVPLSPGVDVSYYYMITLSKPYTDMGGLDIPKFAFIDPRNRQIRTDGLSQAIEGLLESELTDLDPGVRSVFTVPEVNQQQSLWVRKLDFAHATDNVAHQLDVNVSYLGGHTDSIAPQMIYVDRMAPTAKVALNLAHPGMNAGMYMRPDGTYVATARMEEEASLTVSLEEATSNEIDGFPAYLFQLARLNPAGNPGTWNPVVTADLLPLTWDKLINDPASVFAVDSRWSN